MSVIASIPNVGSQIERAIVAYLMDAYGATFIAAQGLNFYTSNDWKTRVAPCVSVLASHSDETPAYSMDKDFFVTVEVVWKGNNEIGQENLESNRVSIDNLIGVAEAAMSQTTTGQNRQATCDAINTFGRALATGADAANNTDMANFTCLKVMSMGDRRAEKNEAGGVNLREVRTFKVSACPANVD
jgi:hypothetical protein